MRIPFSRGFLLVVSICLAQPAWSAPADRPAAASPRASTPASVEAKRQTARFVIQPPQEAQLASQMSGVIQRYVVKEGAAFRRGDRLVEFDCAERRASLDKARAAQERSEKTEASQRQLHAMKAISDLDLDTAIADLKVARAEVSMAQAQAGQCVISAPYAGRVVRRMANPYEHVNVGAPLMQIVESGTLRLDMLVPSLWLRWLKPGQEFTAHVDEAGTEFRAKVVSLGARVDAASQTVSVRAEFVGNASSLLPGMSGTADFGSR